MTAANSAAHESTILNTGCTPSWWRLRVTANSSEPSDRSLNPLAGKPASASAMCKSVKPAPFHILISSSGTSAGLRPISPAARISVSMAAMFSNRCRNQRVTPPVMSRTSSVV